MPSPASVLSSRTSRSTSGWACSKAASAWRSASSSVDVPQPANRIVVPAGSGVASAAASVAGADGVGVGVGVNGATRTDSTGRGVTGGRSASGGTRSHPVTPAATASGRARKMARRERRPAAVRGRRGPADGDGFATCWKPWGRPTGDGEPPHETPDGPTCARPGAPGQDSSGPPRISLRNTRALTPRDTLRQSQRTAGPARDAAHSASPPARRQPPAPTAVPCGRGPWPPLGGLK